MNIVFSLIIISAFICAAYLQLTTGAGTMAALSKAMIDSAGSAVTLSIGLIGVMALFLGLMKIAEKGGLLSILARLIRPIMIRLFPEVPPDHPAMGAMILNLSANMLGLGNAATPFGIRAMQELDRLNPSKGTATDSMALFLAINTSNITLLPTGVIALRAAAGSADPAGILPTTLFATIGSTLTAVVAAKLYRRFASPVIPSEPEDSRTVEPQGGRAEEGNIQAEATGESPEQDESSEYPLWVTLLFLGSVFSLVPFMVVYGQKVSSWILPCLVIGFIGFGLARRVRIYEAFVEGAKDGFDVAVRIIPYLVAILVAVGMFKASGALDKIVGFIGPFTAPLGLPAEALPMALLRPLSGSGAYGILASIINDPSIGPDSYTGYLVSTLQGSTETTFYVLAVYFGAVSVRRIRHTLAAALTADLAGVVFAVLACRWFLS